MTRENPDFMLPRKQEFARPLTRAGVSGKRAVLNEQAHKAQLIENVRSYHQCRHQNVVRLDRWIMAENSLTTHRWKAPFNFHNANL